MDRTRGIGVLRKQDRVCVSGRDQFHFSKIIRMRQSEFLEFSHGVSEIRKIFRPPLKKKRNMVYLALNGSEEQFFGEISVCFQFFLHL